MIDPTRRPASHYPKIYSLSLVGGHVIIRAWIEMGEYKYSVQGRRATGYGPEALPELEEGIAALRDDFEKWQAEK